MSNEKKQIYILIVVLVIVLAGLGFYYFNQNKNKSVNNIDKFSEISSQEQKDIIEATIDNIDPAEIASSDDLSDMKDFYNKDHNISMQYPASWQQVDLGGEKKVTEPLMRENIGFFYINNSEINKDDPNTATTSIKLLRFVLEDSSVIKSLDDWLDYIKSKVNDFVSHEQLSKNYKLKNVTKSSAIDGKWTVVEDYDEYDLISGKDYYIYAGNEFYQFVTRIPNKFVNNFSPLVEKTVNSFNKK